jgi:hypothetical protein
MTEQDLMIDGIFDFVFQGPDDSDQWVGQYPVIQWNNKEKAWEFPLSQWPGSQIEAAYELVNVDHGETDEAGFLVPVINISVIAHRSVWEAQDIDGSMIYTQKPNFEVARWSKRYNFLVICQETGDLEPCIITVKGYTGEAMFKAVSQGRKRTVNMVKQLTGKSLPGYLFWLTLSAGAKQLVGNEVKSTIYPPCVMTHEISKMKKPDLVALLKALYVGDTLRDMYTAGLYDQGQQWANEGPQKALPAPSPVRQIEAPRPDPVAEVLPDNTLYFPDLSQGSRDDWMVVALSIPDLFEDRGDVNRAFSSALRAKKLSGQPSPDQWEVWRDELTRRWIEKEEIPF